VPTAIYLGIDVGAVTTKVVAVGGDGALLARSYLRNCGRVADSLQRALAEVRAAVPEGSEVVGLGTTGSGRALAADLLGADVVKNEITAHTLGTLHLVPDVQTIIEIGGQDSKLIILRDGLLADFAANTVCAAGTGSFLDHQAQRLGVPLEELGEMARRSQAPAAIPGRCTVFVESDMIQLQQAGTPVADIAAGLCGAIVRNFLSGLGRRLEIVPPVVFQGGVAGNVGVRDAFERALGVEVTVPPHHEVIAALGVALLTSQQMATARRHSRFRGWPAQPAKATE
jgi:predicted CoA-substrate-specific enzyme activase